jgi:integrase
LWQDVDFESNVIHIRRILEPDGSSTDMTKTVAGPRDIPMAPLLREMLREWRVRCPRLKGELHRVFPGLRTSADLADAEDRWWLPTPLLEFPQAFWRPAFVKTALPYVTPHSARHCFISTMQAQGVEVGLVAKLAGHANGGKRQGGRSSNHPPQHTLALITCRQGPRAG